MNSLVIDRTGYIRTGSHEACRDGTLPDSSVPRSFRHLPRVSTMATSSRRPKGRGGLRSTLNVSIEAMNLAKEISSVTPAKAVFGSVSVVLTMIRVCFLLFCGNELPVHLQSGFYDE